MALANDGVAFPVAHPGFVINDSRAFINANAVGNASSAILFAIALAPFFLATQVFMEIATSALVLINMKWISREKRSQV